MGGTPLVVSVGLSVCICSSLAIFNAYNSYPRKKHKNTKTQKHKNAMNQILLVPDIGSMILQYCDIQCILACRLVAAGVSRHADEVVKERSRHIYPFWEAMSARVSTACVVRMAIRKMLHEVREAARVYANGQADGDTDTVTRFRLEYRTSGYDHCTLLSRNMKPCRRRAERLGCCSRHLAVARVQMQRVFTGHVRKFTTRA